MANRTERARLAAETVAITTAGRYQSPGGTDVSIAAAVELAIHETRLIRPGDWRSVGKQAALKLRERSFKTAFEVHNETTFAAGRRLVEKYGPDVVAALNFASAKNPGGGFLGGSQAQEESLARSSALYACLQSQMEYYGENRRAPSLLYTDHMIVSPRVPVFRDDEDVLLERPWEITILTAPAPNAGAVAQNEPQNVEEIEPTFRRRIEQVLSAAIWCDQTAIVLGAWGCGVFKNEPTMVANLFAAFLLGNGAFAKAFEHVAFAVLDRDGNTLGAFAEAFDSGARSV